MNKHDSHVRKTAPSKPDKLDGIIVDIMKKHTELGYNELERQVQAVQKEAGLKPSTHMTIYTHVKRLQERGVLGHQETPKGYPSPYYLIQYDDRLKKAAENYQHYLEATEQMFSLVKDAYEKLSSDEKSKALLCVISITAFLRLQIGLARQYVENVSFLKAEENRLTDIVKDINRFATRQRDTDLLIVMDGMLDAEVKRMFYMVGDIIEPKMQTS
jgi:hypothetical protein